MVDTAETAEMMKRLGTGFDATIGLEYTELSQIACGRNGPSSPRCTSPPGYSTGVCTARWWSLSPASVAPCGWASEDTWSESTTTPTSCAQRGRHSHR